MDSQVIINKIAVDEKSRKLGKIVRIELLPGKTIKKDIPYAMICFSRLFRKDIIIPIEIQKILKYDIRYVWFNITKEEFDKEIERLMKEKLDRENYRGGIKVKLSTRGVLNFDPSNLSYTQKERKK